MCDEHVLGALIKFILRIRLIKLADETKTKKNENSLNRYSHNYLDFSWY